jgi:hypothetical protein
LKLYRKQHTLCLTAINNTKKFLLFSYRH